VLPFPVLGSLQPEPPAPAKLSFTPSAFCERFTPKVTREAYPLYFDHDPNCPSHNPFFLITIWTAPAWGSPNPTFSSHFFARNIFHERCSFPRSFRPLASSVRGANPGHSSSCFSTAWALFHNNRGVPSSIPCSPISTLALATPFLWLLTSSAKHSALRRAPTPTKPGLGGGGVISCRGFRKEPGPSLFSPSTSVLCLAGPFLYLLSYCSPDPPRLHWPFNSRRFSLDRL